MNIINIKQYTDWEIGVHNIIRNTFFDKSILVMDDSNLGQISIKDLSNIPSKEMKQKIWNDTINSFREILNKIPNLAYKSSDSNLDNKKDKYIYVSTINICQAEIIHEDSIIVRFENIYGHTFDGKREEFPIEFVERLISLCKPGDINNIPLDYCIDEFNVWFRDSGVADRIIKDLYEINKICADKYGIWCNFYKRYETSGFVNMKFIKRHKSTYGCFSPVELLSNGIYQSYNANFIKEYSNGLDINDYYKRLFENKESNKELKKLGWNPDVPITLNNISIESDRTKKRMTAPIVTPIVQHSASKKVVWILDIVNGPECINTIFGFVDKDKEYWYAFDCDNLLKRAIPQNYMEDGYTMNKYFIYIDNSSWGKIKTKLNQITDHLRYSSYHYDEFANYCRFRQNDFGDMARIICFAQFLQYILTIINREDDNILVGFDSLSKYLIPQIYLLNTDMIKYNNSDKEK